MKSRLLPLLIAALLIGADTAVPVYTHAFAAQPVKKSSKKKSSSKKSSTTKKQQSSSNKKSSSQKSKKPTSSAEAKSRHEATQREIRQTKEQIEANERSVKKNLTELGRLEQEIGAGKRELAKRQAQVAELDKKISQLTAQVEENNRQLQRLRDTYLEAVKKMRLKKGNQSTLAFIFASENFNQALRRMRYLKQFSTWKETQSSEIKKRVAELERQNKLLEQNKAEQTRALQLQDKAQRSLEEQHSRQNAVVADLRQQGSALKSHLQKKQQEANELNATISTLIAQEEQARREEQRRQEALQAEQRRKAEEAERARAEEQKRAEAAEKEKAAAAAAAKPQKEEKKKTEKKKEEKKKEEKKKTSKDKATTSDKSYAEARKRAPRSNAASTGNSESAAPATSAAPAASAASSFAAAKGSLPRPVGGKFTIVSPFGRHKLPNLPDVEYDNPGIDAEVSDGAVAQAVYGGKVSGVYVMPGYQTVVIVQHGNYYTVYGNLTSSAVSKGETIKQGQTIGKVASEDGKTVIHFEVWKNHEKLNPQQWIR